MSKFPKTYFMSGEQERRDDYFRKGGPKPDDAIDWRDDQEATIGEYRLVRKLRVKRSLEIAPKQPKRKRGK